MARFLKQTGLGLVVIYLVIGAGFITGAIFRDRGGWRAVALSAFWLVPLGSLVALAWWSPVWGARLLVVLGAAVVAAAVWGALRPGTWTSWEDDAGPIRAVAVFAVASPLGFLGWRRPVFAGTALVVVGTVSAGLATLSTEAGGPAALVAATVPSLVAGTLYLLSAAPTAWRLRSAARRRAQAE